MKGGNAAILRHAAAARALRLFEGARGYVTYKGQFELDAERPFYTTDAPESKPPARVASSCSVCDPSTLIPSRAARRWTSSIALGLSTWR